MAEQPVVTDVLKDEVVGSQGVKDVGHRVAFQVPLGSHGLLETGDRLFVGEDAEHARHAEVGIGI